MAAPRLYSQKEWQWESIDAIPPHSSFYTTALTSSPVRGQVEAEVGSVPSYRTGPSFDFLAKSHKLPTSVSSSFRPGEAIPFATVAHSAPSYLDTGVGAGAGILVAQSGPLLNRQIPGVNSNSEHEWLDAYFLRPSQCQKIGTWCCGKTTHIVATCGGDHTCNISFKNVHTFNYKLNNAEFTDLSGRYWLIPVTICNLSEVGDVFISAW